MDFSLTYIRDLWSRLELKVTWPDVAAYTVIGGSTWLAYKLFVKPFMSPLRKIPGPGYKPIVGNMFDALRSEAMSNTIHWMTTYKSRIIRFYFLYGECRVLVGDPDLVKYISVTNSKNYERLVSISSFERMAQNFVLFKRGEEHHALRRLMNPAFSLKSVESFIPAFSKHAERVAEIWSQQITENGTFSDVDAQMMMLRLTLDLVCECAFDYQINAVENPSTAGVQSFRRILQGNKITLMQMLPFFRLIPTRTNRQLWEDGHVFTSAISKVIAEKRSQLEATQLGQKLEHKGDLLSILFQAHDEHENRLSDGIIFDQIAGFLFAGFETTSTLLTWTLLMLSEHPEVQEKLRCEVTTVWPSGEVELTANILDKMTYLSCVVKESLRLYPPVSVLFRTAIHDDSLNGYFIPAGTVVGISISALHRLPENWKDPTDFKPERFLDTVDHYRLNPFGSGPYMCIGHRFSILEASAILATLLRKFRFRKVPGYEYRPVRYITIQPHPPLVLRATLVED